MILRVAAATLGVAIEEVKEESAVMDTLASAVHLRLNPHLVSTCIVERGDTQR